MKIEKIIGIVLVATALIFGFLYFTGGDEVQTISVGGSSPFNYSRQYFNAGFQSGGSTFATTSTEATYTLLESDIDQDVTYISWNTGLNNTITTMASTSMVFLGNNTGDTRSYDFYSATSTAAATITFAAGTGVDLQELEGGSVIVNGLEGATLKFIRKADSDVLLLVTPWQVGD